MTDTLDGIRDLQAVLLAVLDADLEPENTAVAASRVLARARGSEVPELAVPALAYTLERHLAEMTEEPGAFGDPTERRLIEMHARGEHTCTRCLRQLPDAETIRYWQRERALGAMWRDHLGDAGGEHDPR